LQIYPYLFLCENKIKDLLIFKMSKFYKRLINNN